MNSSGNKWHITKNKISSVLWLLPNGVLVFPPKGSHLFTLLPKGGYGLVHKVCILHHSSSSFTMVPWPPITLLAGPKRTAAIRGFWKAPLPCKAVTDSPKSTLVVSKFSCLIEGVTTSMYWFSSSILSGMVTDLVSSTPDMAGEAVCVVASIKLVFCSTGQSPTGVGLSDSGGSILPKLVELVWGHWLVASRLTLPKPQMMSHLVNMTCSFTPSLNSMTLLARGQISGSSGRLSSSTQYCNPQA